MKRLALAAVGLVALMVGSASAADLGRRPVYAPPAAPIPVYYNWTGLYLGINGGYGLGGTSNFSTGITSNTKAAGGFGGGQVGYNWQYGQFIAGLEGDIQGSDINGSAACVGGVCSVRNDYFGTVRGRLGYAGNGWMPYVTGGLAYGNIRASGPLGSVDNTNVGYAVGGGVEFAIAPSNWTAKVEYLYMDLGNTNCATCVLGGTNVSMTSNLIRGGINYRF